MVEPTSTGQAWIVEIRPGAGSGDASLWAQDVYKMLARYAQRCDYTVEPRPASGSTYAFTIIGRHVDSVFKFEEARTASNGPRVRDRGADPHLDRGR